MPVVEHRVQIVVTVTEVHDTDDDGYEWEQVAARVIQRLRSRRPLDRDARLRVRTVEIDEAG